MVRHILEQNHVCSTKSLIHYVIKSCFDFEITCVINIQCRNHLLGTGKTSEVGEHLRSAFHCRVLQCTCLCISIQVPVS